ncbi:MAG: acyl-ACP--UDP-N-acetylglucosamine O-acyltransferase [Burkholderiales bacterium]
MIHPTAIVDPHASVAADAVVGPYAIIGPDVTIGPECSIGAHVVIEGRTRIGRGNRIFHSCAIGSPPQDKKYAGEATSLEIGDGNTFREFCSVNTGTVQDEGVTRIGDDNWIMAYAHIAHDCRIGSHAILANSTQLAGHVFIGDYAILGGLTGVHQFVKVGAHSMTGGGTILFQDLPPYVLAQGNPAKPYGVNTEGLRRRGFSAEAIDAIRRAYKTLYRNNLTFSEARVAIEDDAKTLPELAVLADFLAAAKRGVLR